LEAQGKCSMFKRECNIYTYQTDRTEVSSCGFGNSPDSNTSSSYDHHSRLPSSTWIQKNAC